MIHVARKGKILGKFSMEEVAEGLALGKFQPSDLAWRDPMPTWVPLQNFDGLPKVNLPAPPPLPKPSLPSWVRWREVGLVAAGLQTVFEVLGRPVEIFRQLPADSSFVRPFAFLLSIGSITGWVVLVYQYAILKFDPELWEQFSKVLGDVSPDSFFLFAALFTPASVAIFGCLLSFLTYATASLIAKPTLSFRGVFTVFAYAWGAASTAQLIPLLGAVLHPLMGLALTAMGLRLSLGMGRWVSAAAAAFPVLVWFVGLLVAQGLLLRAA